MKIICVAKNYAATGEGGVSSAEERAARAAEMGDPVFFLKPDTALLRNNDPFYVPDFTSCVDYECELVVRINRVGRSIAERFAHRYYSEVTLGIDFTARDQQRAAMTGGLPWEAAKAFDHSAALAPTWIPLAELGTGREFGAGGELGRGEMGTGGEIGGVGRGSGGETVKGRGELGRGAQELGAGDPQDLRFEMALDGEIKQRGWTGDMIFGLDRVIAHVSRFITLKIGDLIYTGTPAGVGAVAPGQRLTATLEGRELLDFEIR